MSSSSIRVGLALGGGRRKIQRGGLSWAQSSSAAAVSPIGERLRLSQRSRRPAAVSVSPTPTISDIEAGPLSFLSARQTMILATVAMVAVLVVLGLVRSNHQAVSHSYQLSHLTQQKLNLLETNRQLKAELAKVSSLAHLETVALETLGLVVPQKGQIVVID